MRCLVMLVSCVFLCGISYAADWVSVDIGTNDAGSTEQDGDNFTLTAGGVDYWGSSDGGRFVYQEVSGDFEISGQVVSVENTNGWAKVGFMARGSVEPASWHVFSLVAATSGHITQWRRTDGASGEYCGSALPGQAPIYIKLVREGNDFSGYWSDDGENWEPNNPCSHTVTIENAPDTILVGLAHTSHAEGVIGESVFKGVTTTFTDMAVVSPKGKTALTWGYLKTY